MGVKNKKGTNFFSPLKYQSPLNPNPTCSVALTDGGTPQLALFAKCLGTPPTTANIFDHGCIIIQTDSGTGVNAVFQNTGSSAVPVWTLLDTALGGGAQYLVDTNGFHAVTVGTTASAVNGLIVTDSVTGAVSANAVAIAPYGTDAAISLLISPKAATGILTLGFSTGTGDIVLGSSSGAQAVKIANGSGAATVNIANVSTAGSTVNIAGDATATGNTDTVNIATGNTVGTGSKVVHIADGTPAGTNLVTIGSLANTANTTTLQGGNGAGAIALTPQTTGVITVGAAAGTGNIVLGSSSAVQSVLVANGAGAPTVSIANASTAGTTVNIASAATATGNTDTTTIAGGNAAGTGIKAVNILTGTPNTSGNNRLTLGGGATTKVTTNAVLTSYQAINYIATETGANNAIAGALTDASGNNITLAAGLRVIVALAHTLQAGANTFALNGTVKNLKSHLNVANNIGTAYAATGTIELIYDGTEWVDMSQ